MSHEVLVKRIIYVAEHKDCEFRDVRVDSPPREIQCPRCRGWVNYEEESWIGQEKIGK